MNFRDTEIFYEVKRRLDKSLEERHYILVLSLYSLQ